MSGNIIGSVVGAALGFVVGGPAGAAIGWSVGGVVGGILMPPDGPDGPRLEDLKGQGSEYGRPIPIIYGTIGVNGNVIWQSDLIEVESETGGDCGSPEVTQYSYFANFALLLCEGEANVLRMWAGPSKRLIFNGALVEGNGTVRIYTGSEDQMPDPLIESYLGAGNVPAYRGYTYVVFEQFPVRRDGNMIPIITAEVSKKGQVEVAPDYLGQVLWVDSWTYDNKVLLTYWGSYKGIIQHELGAGHAFVQHRPMTLAPSQNHAFLDEDRGRLVYYEGSFLATFQIFEIDSGDESEHVIDVPASGDLDPAAPSYFYTAGGCYHNGVYYFSHAPRVSSVGNLASSIFAVDPDSFDTLTFYTYDLPGAADSNIMELLACPTEPTADWLIGLTWNKIRKYPLTAGGVPTTLGDLQAQAISAYQPIYKWDPDTGYLWTFAMTTGTTLRTRVFDVVNEVELLNSTVTLDAQFTSFTMLGQIYVPANGSRPAMMWVFGERWANYDYFFGFYADTPAFAGQHQGVYHGIHNIGKMWYDAGRDMVVAARYTLAGEPRASESGALGTREEIILPNAFDWIIGEGEAAAIREGTPLSDVVYDLSIRAGLPAHRINVEALEDDMVDGYAVASQTTVRGAIQALMPAYFFDAVESNGVVKFTKRGQQAAYEIPDEDLAAHPSSASTDGTDPLQTIRAMDDELPLLVDVNYLNANLDYAKVNKKAMRQIGVQGTIFTLDLPMVLTDTKAAEVAETTLHGSWVGRRSYKFFLPARKYAFLEPTDVVVIRGLGMRIVKAVLTNDGVLECDAVHDDSHTWEPFVIVTETPPREQEVAVVGVTILELM